MIYTNDQYNEHVLNGAALSVEIQLYLRIKYVPNRKYEPYV